MNKKLSQKNQVLKILREEGMISRNQCLRAYISRLGSIINLLKSEGKIEVTSAEYEEGDYVYRIKPPKLRKFYVNGELVATKKLF